MKKKKLALWAGIIGASCLFGAAIALLGVTGDARTIALVLWSVVIITVYAIVTMSDGRKTVAKIYSEAAAEKMIIQYGGSMNDKNAAELLAKENVDGGLIGGASLKVDAFTAIVDAAQ